MPKVIYDPENENREIIKEATYVVLIRDVFHEEALTSNRPASTLAKT